MSRLKRTEDELDRLHRLRLMAGAARFIAEKAEQETDTEARRLMAYIETLTAFIEQDMSKLLAEE